VLLIGTHRIVLRSVWLLIQAGGDHRSARPYEPDRCACDILHTRSACCRL